MMAECKKYGAAPMKMLKKIGFSVIEANDGSAGLDVYSSAPEPHRMCFFGYHAAWDI
jgi:hypothetical protein